MSDLAPALVDQIDWHWQHQLRPRFDGLTDDEYLWRPVPGAWTIHPRHTPSIDWTFPPPEPAPFTTIAWRLAHMIVGVLALRNHQHFDGPSADYDTWPYAPTAAGALAQLDEQYSTWIAGVGALDDEALARPNGEPGPWAEHPMRDLVLHINRELIHHGAEVSLLRDLYRHLPPEKRL